MTDIQTLDLSYKSGTINAATRLSIIRADEGFKFSLMPLPESSENELSSDREKYETPIAIFKTVIDRIGKNNVKEIINPEDGGLITYEEMVSIVGKGVHWVTRLKI